MTFIDSSRAFWYVLFAMLTCQVSMVHPLADSSEWQQPELNEDHPPQQKSATARNDKTVTTDCIKYSNNVRDIKHIHPKCLLEQQMNSIAHKLVQENKKLDSVPVSPFSPSEQPWRSGRGLYDNNTLSISRKSNTTISYHMDMLRNILLPILPIDPFLEEKFSPHYRALQWLASEQQKQSLGYEHLPAWRYAQRYTLALLYFATNNGPEGWNRQCQFLSQQHECQWNCLENRGVTCNVDERVNMLWLDNFGLNGTIPQELFLLSHLSTLFLNENYLTGTIPATLGQIPNLLSLVLEQNNLEGTLPSDFGQVHKNLVLFYAGHNHLSGPIPTQLGSLTGLSTLSLWNNDFSGTLPTELGQLASLSLLFLSNNNLEGSLPAEFFQLERVTHLLLDGNHFNGTLVTGQFGTLKTLQHLSLSANNFSGTLPWYLWQMPALNLLNLTGNAFSGNLSSSMDESSTSRMLQLQHLLLSDNALSGTLPASLGEWTNLQQVDLHKNRFYGNIPTQIGGLTHLESLSLSENDFSGSLPVELGQLTNLAVFDISHNRLVGSIAPWIGNLTNLTSVIMEHNAFSGMLPTALWRLTKLQDLQLGGNRFTGTLSDELGNLSALTVLRISNNSMEGLLPLSIGNLTRLQELVLYRNQFSGLLPANMGYLTELKQINLYDNSFFGTIPSEFGRLTFVQSIVLDDNKFSGRIPSEMGSMASVTVLSMVACHLSGEIPSEISLLRNLVDLRLHSNGLTGPIPSSLGNLTMLQQLRLDQNQLSERIPTELGKMHHLTQLSLWDNLLTGPIPNELGNCTELRDLSLEQNVFNETIPASIGRLTQLEHLSLRNNFLSGSVATDVGLLSHLTMLDFSHNELNSTLPSSIGNLRQLTRLELHNNNFTGTVPTGVGHLVDLTSLSLHSCSMSGEIPTEMAQLHNLKFLDLSSNRLDGPIPMWISNYTRITHLSLAENELFGTVPSEVGALQDIRRLDLHGNLLVGFLPSELSQATNLTELLLSNNKLRGSIPAVLSLMPKLEVLDLGTNQFKGTLPVDLMTLTSLRKLNLASNRFSGTIPSEFGSLSWLHALDLSRNNFSGGLPLALTRLDLMEEIILSNNILSGTILPQIKNLNQLRRLHLDNNRFTGVLPVALGRLTFLRELKVSNSRHLKVVSGAGENAVLESFGIGGGIPEEFGELEFLRTLDLSGNVLTGSVPKELGKLERIENLDLSANELTGRIPFELGKLKQAEMALRENRRLFAPAPLSLCSVTGFDLHQVELWCPQERNILKKFYETTKGSLWSFSGAEDTLWVDEYSDHCNWYGVNCSRTNTKLVSELKLQGNDLQGTILHELANLRSLKRLRLENNKLFGTIPTELASLDQLRELNLKENQLTGSLPSSIAQLKSLTSLLLSKNLLSGTVLPEVHQLAQLTSLSLASNNLHGQVRNVLRTLSQMPRLQQVDLSNNALAGSIPSNFLKEMKTLRMTGNRLKMPAPSTLCHADPLLDFDLRNSPEYCPEKAFLEDLFNSTEGGAWKTKTNWGDRSLSVCAWHGVTCHNKTLAITALELKGNNMLGTIPLGIGGLSSLKWIDFSDNMIIGALPSPIWELKELRHLNFAGNQLTGRLPAIIGFASRLNNVSLQGNRLTGSIPHEIQHLSRLQHLDLSSNAFVGSIPEGFVSLSSKFSLWSLVLRNNSLSGAPPDVLCRNESLQFDLRDTFAWCPVNLYNEPGVFVTSALLLAACFALTFCLRAWKRDWVSCIKKTSMLSFMGLVREDKDSKFDVHESSLEKRTALSTRSLGIFAIGILVLQVLVTALGSVLSFRNSVVEISVALSGLVGWYLGILLWAVSLPKKSSAWPFRVSLLILPPASALGLLSEDKFAHNFGIVTALLYLGWSLPSYLVTMVLRNVIIQDSAENMNTICISMLRKFFAVLPPILYFAMEAVQLFLKASSREEGVSSFHENHLEAWAAVFTALVILLTLVSNEVMLMAQLGVRDMVSLRLTVWENLSIASNVVLISLALFLQTVVENFEGNMAKGVICAVIAGPAWQLLALWQVSLDVLYAVHPYLRERKEQNPIETPRGETDEAPIAGRLYDMGFEGEQIIGGTFDESECSDPSKDCESLTRSVMSRRGQQFQVNRLEAIREPWEEEEHLTKFEVNDAWKKNSSEYRDAEDVAREKFSEHLSEAKRDAISNESSSYEENDSKDCVRQLSKDSYDSDRKDMNVHKENQLLWRRVEDLNSTIDDQRRAIEGLHSRNLNQAKILREQGRQISQLWSLLEQQRKKTCQ